MRAGGSGLYLFSISLKRFSRGTRGRTGTGAASAEVDCIGTRNSSTAVLLTE